MTECSCRVATTSHSSGEGTIEFCPLHKAAKDLLEAAREVLALWNGCCPGNNHTESDRAYSMLRSAFAKAIGKESQREERHAYPADKHSKTPHP